MKPSRGFSLVELMVAMALSLLLIGGALSIFFSSRVTYQATDEASHIQETGRLALEFLLRDIRNAGWQGCAQNVPVVSTLSNADDLLWNFDEPVFGFDAAVGDTDWAPALDAAVVDAVTGNDVLVTRGPRRDARPLRLTAAVATGTDTIETEVLDPAPDPLPIRAGDVVQVADCAGMGFFQTTGYNAASGEVARAAGGADPGNDTDDFGLGFTEAAELVPVETVIYYLRDSDTLSGPALWRQAGAGAAVELFEGVEGLQVRYGVDTDNDRQADQYDSAVEVDDADRWGAVVSVTLALLVRGPEQQGVTTDVREYDLLGETYGPFNDRRSRKVYTATATLRNRVP